MLVYGYTEDLETIIVVANLTTAATTLGNWADSSGVREPKVKPAVVPRNDEANSV